MKIKDLIEATGTTERQIRYLISEGFVPPPRGGRSNADYGNDHVVAVRRYSRLRDLGFPPAAIKLMLDAKEGAPFPVAPGVTLTVSPELLGSGLDPKPIAHSIEVLLTDVLKGSEDEPRHANKE